MDPFDPVTWSVLAVAAVLGGCFQGSVGFGLGFTVVPLLVVVEPMAVPTVPLLLGLPLLAGTVLGDLSGLDLGGSGWLMLGRLPGTAVGAGLLLVVHPDLLGLVVGAVLLLTVTASLVGGAPPLTSATRLGAGFASGVMGTAAGVGGPPVSILYRGQTGRVMRATVGVALLVGVLMSLTAVVVTRRWELGHAMLAVTLLPPSMLGLWGSRRLNRSVDDRWMQGLVLGLGAVAGVAAMVQALVS